MWKVFLFMALKPSADMQSGWIEILDVTLFHFVFNSLLFFFSRCWRVCLIKATHDGIQRLMTDELTIYLFIYF